MTGIPLRGNISQRGLEREVESASVGDVVSRVVDGEIEGVSPGVFVVIAKKLSGEVGGLPEESGDGPEVAVRLLRGGETAGITCTGGVGDGSRLEGDGGG